MVQGSSLLSSLLTAPPGLGIFAAGCLRTREGYPTRTSRVPLNPLVPKLNIDMSKHFMFTPRFNERMRWIMRILKPQTPIFTHAFSKLCRKDTNHLWHARQSHTVGRNAVRSHLRGTMRSLWP